jgi:hypothetical protein
MVEAVIFWRRTRSSCHQREVSASTDHSYAYAKGGPHHFFLVAHDVLLNELELALVAEVGRMACALDNSHPFVKHPEQHERLHS